MLFVGEGWGKSAAAFGYATRSAGRGWRTLVIQFLKGESWNPAEIESARKLGIEWPTFARGLTWAQRNPSAIAESAWQLGHSAIESGDYGLVVLDEVTHAVSAGWVTDTAVADTLRRRAPTTSVILTGRSAPRRVRSAADTITRFDSVKHREKAGILA